MSTDETSIPSERWFDSHCHLHDVDDAASTLDRASVVGVEFATFVGTDHESSLAAGDLAQRLAATGRSVWSSIGLHPHDAKNGIGSIEPLVRQKINPTAEHPLRTGDVVAIGECGLDYYYEHSPRDVQRNVFAQQIALCHEMGVALIVHTRDAWEDTFAILEKEGVPHRTIIHCFSGGPDEARTCLSLGAYLSFSGIVTFKNADDVREAALVCPDDRLLIETDSPFLAPIPHRGQPNEPAYVAIVGHAVAELRGTTPSAMAKLTTENAMAVFAVHE